MKIIVSLVLALIISCQTSFAAIAFDSSGNACNGSGTSISCSFTNTAGTFMVAIIATEAQVTTISAVKYNNVTMTSQVSIENAGGVTHDEIFTLASPATGANTFVATLSTNNGGWAVNFITLTGVGSIDKTGSNTGNPFSLTINEAQNNEWIVDGAANNNTNTCTAGGSQAHSIGNNSGFGWELWSSTLGPSSSGNNTVSWTCTAAQPAYVGIALIPSGAAAATVGDKKKKLMRFKLVD